MRFAHKWLCTLLIFSLLGCAPQDRSDRGPLVLAASSLQEALEPASDKWTAAGHERPVLSFAGTSALARQIEAGAQGDLFISADETWMDEVQRKGLIEPSSRTILLGNDLVLVAPAAMPEAIEIGPGFGLAERLSSGRLAMADPDAVPAGRYGKQALVSLGVWDSVSGRIATAENVRAALALVSRGEAPLGIVYATDASAEPDVAVVGRFPPESHDPIVYPIARLKTAPHPDAESFRLFLLSESGKAVFRRFGFATTN
jgi:molybdate transport system substrate-binding protein